MKRVCLLIVLLKVVNSWAGQAFINPPGESGIKFESELNWPQILKKAQKENKFIFIDFYATWCGPCKEMDKEVYESDEVGKICNANCISIKVQVDKTPNDDTRIKQWYRDADSLNKKFNVSILPTLVFISPTGEVAGRREGRISKGEFLAAINQAISTDSGYFAQLTRYRKHQLNWDEVQHLALEAKKNGEDSLGLIIANDYKDNYLGKHKDSTALSDTNIRFLAEFPTIIKTSDAFFDFFYHRPDEAEHVAGIYNGYATAIVGFIVSNDDIRNFLYKGGKPIRRIPDWDKLFSYVEQKYGKVWADRLIFPSKLQFYTKTGNYGELARTVDNQIERYPPHPGSKYLGGPLDDLWQLNANAWHVFLSCNEKPVLQKAVKWIDISIRHASENKEDITQYLDTKANLLYKIGEVNQAIDVEEQALRLSKNAEEYKSNLAKMRSGSPTWPVNQ